MSQAHSLICFDCNTRRNKFGKQIKRMGKVAGHVCIKCSKKREVADRSAGIGWRNAFQIFARKIFSARVQNNPVSVFRPVLGRVV